MKKILIILGIVILISATLILLYQNYFSGDKYNPDKNIETITEEVNREAIEIIAENLEIPWSVEFLPGGDLLVTERPGNILRISKGEKIQIATIDDVKADDLGHFRPPEVHP